MPRGDGLDAGGVRIAGPRGQGRAHPGGARRHLSRRPRRQGSPAAEEKKKTLQTSARDPYLFLPDLIKFGKQVFMFVFFQ